MTTLLILAARNLLRNKFRSIFTIVVVALAVVTVILFQTVLAAWTAGADFAAKDRVITRHKITFILPMPLRYIEDIKQVPGVRSVTFGNFFGGKDPNHETEFFGSLAVDDRSWFDVYNDFIVEKDVMDRWMEDRQGAIVGDVLAAKLGWKVGDKVTLTGTIFPGDWPFTISGLYKAGSKVVDRSTFMFHWKYLNEAVPQRAKDQVGWVASRIDQPTRSAEIATSIDKVFDSRDVQTISQSERAFNLSFLASFSSVLTALNWVSLAMLAVLALVIGNTIAMGVRERTNEYGVLRAIGFLPRHMAILVLLEGMVVGAVGAALGLLGSYPFVERAVGRWLEENMGQFFPFFRIPGTIALAAAATALLLGVLASLLPARRAFGLNIVQALRRVG